ncbi:MAG: hypothetical protein Q9217_002909 [Psora testacea]
MSQNGQHQILYDLKNEGEGHVEAIVDLLNNDEEEEEDNTGNVYEVEKVDVLRYQDQIRTMNSGLHIAIHNQRSEVAWLLLLLASNLDHSLFPAEVLLAAEHLGLNREDQSGNVDIRTLQDAGGMTAEQRAAETGGVWKSGSG